MSDLIDRQAALDALWHERERLEAFRDECLKDISMARDRALTKIERNRVEADYDIIFNLKSAWIPCSERLPKEKGEYLVTYHPCYWDRVMEETKVGIDSFRGKTTWAKKKYQRVIAWMPLPESYRDKEDDE